MMPAGMSLAADVSTTLAMRDGGSKCAALTIQARGTHHNLVYFEAARSSAARIALPSSW